MVIRASIVGGSGYVGGELLRLLSHHPQVEVAQVTSERHAGRYVHGRHPNLRGICGLQFDALESLNPCDLLFVCLPHGQAAERIEGLATLAPRLIDSSADFRLDDAANYRHWYGQDHPAAAWLDRFVYGLPETRRSRIASARYVSGVGCNATAVNLALLPLARRGAIDRVVVDLKVGSSEGGNESSPASHHPERSGALRSFAPTTHRHEAEIRQELGDVDLHFSATAVEMVRGVLCTAHVFLGAACEGIEDKQIWNWFREDYGEEPFVRIVRDRRGLYRFPEPKILAGSNFCDVGFALESERRRLVVISALDNLMKGAAGTAVQAMNLMCDWNESAGLDFPGLHPI